MNGMEILRGTPLWVWVLAIFLLSRGIMALRPREATVKQLFILPGFFLIWGIYTVISQTELLTISITTFIVSFVVGGVLGGGIGHYQPGLRDAQQSGYIVRAGSALPLIVIILAFGMKFWLSVNLALNPGLATNTQFCLQFGGLTGGVAGVLWGATLMQFFPWYIRKRKSA